MNRHHGYSILLSAVIVLTLAGCSKGKSPPENKTSGGTAKGAFMVEKKGFDVYNQEGRLKDILDKSENFKDFVGNLRKNGYKVVAKK